MDALASSSSSLPIVFTTRTTYVLPSQKFMIPTSWKRYHLSELINKSLGLDKPVPFDFLINGEILRVSLGEWCEQKSVGTEETLEVEYVESVMPPQRVSGFPQDDWISSVLYHSGGFITGSYDATIRVFSSSLDCTHSISGHTAPVTSIAVLDTSSEERTLVASASHDLTGRISAFSEDSTTALASLHLHTAPLSSIAASKDRLLTAGWDSLIGFWNTDIPETHQVDDGAAERKKRRKVEQTAPQDPAKRKAPLAVLKSHTNRVTHAIFGTEENEGFSCSLDSTVRCWNLEAGVCMRTITAPERPFLSLSLLSESKIVLASSTDRTVTGYSPAANSFNTAVVSFPHPSTPSVLCASPTNSNHLASGAYDGVVRLWDLRSPKSPLSSFRYVGANRLNDEPETMEPGSNQVGSGKILAMDWGKGVLVVGGERGVDVWCVSEATPR